jgi:mono/diheme cytochrome c family protein
MTRGRKVFLGFVVLACAGAAIALELFLERGISARDQPTAVEAFVARRLRHLAVPRDERQTRNPVPSTPDSLDRARAHFADHCASCHGNDGRGKTSIGQNLYPRAPDMTLPDTQSLSDGELFSIIENGIRLTGMPAWGDPGPEDDNESWELVHFIRHLPNVRPEELAQMESLNPKSRKELEEEEEVRRFLEGGAPEAPAPSGHKH